MRVIDLLALIEELDLASKIDVLCDGEALHHMGVTDADIEELYHLLSLPPRGEF